MPRTVADYIAEALLQQGVKRVYGVVGDFIERLHGCSEATEGD